MNVAFEVESQKEVYAHTLNGRDNLKKLKFTCVSDVCQIPVFAYAIHTNKQMPHFRKQRGQEHHKDCAYSNLYELLRTKGLSGHRISEGDLKKAGYPSLFSINTEEDDLEEDEVFTSQNDNPGHTVKTITCAVGHLSEINPFTGKRVTSIKFIVAFFLGHPASRYAKITIDGMNYTYQTLFKEIKADTKHIGATNQFFYAKVLMPTDQSFEICCKETKYNTYVKLFAKDFKTNNNHHYEIAINRNIITSNKYNKLIKNFSASFSETIENNQPDYALYVFFIGNAPILEDSTTFNLINGHIHFEYTDIRETVNETTFDM